LRSVATACAIFGYIEIAADDRKIGLIVGKQFALAAAPSV